MYVISCVFLALKHYLNNHNYQSFLPMTASVRRETVFYHNQTKVASVRRTTVFYHNQTKAASVKRTIVLYHNQIRVASVRRTTTVLYHNQTVTRRRCT